MMIQDFYCALGGDTEYIVTWAFRKHDINLPNRAGALEVQSDKNQNYEDVILQ